MKSLLFIAVVIYVIVASGCFTQEAEGQKATASQPPNPVSVDRRPVIVELFTSEGCSSCPPADRALKFLAEQQPVRNAEIIPLAFHVDYWNYLGWKDRFSSPAFSRRQEIYVQRFGLDSSYTPEMVIDGQSEFIGSDTGRASKFITEAASRNKGNVLAALSNGFINVTVSDLPAHHPSTVFLAVTEDRLTSNVTNGENAGVTFVHTSVVRSLTSLGLIEKGANGFQINGTVPEIADLKTDDSRIVVFVQDNFNRKIIAATVVALSK